MGGAVIAGVVGGVVLIGVILFMAMRVHQVAASGTAIIVYKGRKRGNIDVRFGRAWVWPIIQNMERIDINMKTVMVERRGAEGVICRDNIRADISFSFFVKVNKTTEDIIRVAESFGCGRAADSKEIEALFAAKFSEAIKTIVKRIDFEELYNQRDYFRDTIIEAIGDDLNGFSLEDLAIDYLEQTPLDQLDPQNILDAQGIQKITEITAERNVRTAELKAQEATRLKRVALEAREKILELQRMEAEAEARQAREIETYQLREQSEVLRTKLELARESASMSKELSELQTMNPLSDSAIRSNVGE